MPNYTDDLIFMQDNALICTAKKVKEWFEERGIVEGQKASIALPDCTGYRTP